MINFFFLFLADATKKADSNPLTEILKCPTKVVLLRVSCVLVFPPYTTDLNGKTCIPVTVTLCSLDNSELHLGGALCVVEKMYAFL